MSLSHNVASIKDVQLMPRSGVFGNRLNTDVGETLGGGSCRLLKNDSKSSYCLLSEQSSGGLLGAHTSSVKVSKLYGK